MIALALGGAGANHAQVISGVDAAETARFARVTRAVAGAGFITPAMVAHGDTAFDRWFLMYATQHDSGVLVLAIEPGAHPLVLERARVPADIGYNGVHFSSFLGTPRLFDVEVSHRPFMLETSMTFSTHHIVRQSGDSLEPVCELPGNSQSSTSKGLGSRTESRIVKLDAVPGQAMSFTMTSVEETATQANGSRSAVVEPKPAVVRRFQIKPSGTCAEVPAGRAGR